MSNAELIIRLSIAAAGGLLLGIEREAGGHPAGIRTHLLVAVGACMFTTAGAYGFPDIPRSSTTDPARIAAQVASGLGFVGAGAILRAGASVRGLTTAATIWMSGSVGVAAGAGAYVAVGVALALVLSSLVAVSAAQPVVRRLTPHIAEIDVRYQAGAGTIGPLLRGISDLHGRVDEVTVEDDSADHLRHVRIRIRIRHRDRLRDLLDDIQSRPEVHTAVVR